MSSAGLIAGFAYVREPDLVPRVSREPNLVIF
jgi:hypothetical protein